MLVISYTMGVPRSGQSSWPIGNWFAVQYVYFVSWSLLPNFVLLLWVMFYFLFAACSPSCAVFIPFLPSEALLDTEVNLTYIRMSLERNAKYHPNTEKCMYFLDDSLHCMWSHPALYSPVLWSSGQRAKEQRNYGSLAKGKGADSQHIFYASAAVISRSRAELVFVLNFPVGQSLFPCCT